MGWVAKIESEPIYYVTTKQWRFLFPETPFGRISWAIAASCNNSLGQKIRFFLARTARRGNFLTFFRQQLPAKNYNDIFLAMARDLHILVRNLCILARRDWPFEEKFGVTPCRSVPATNFLEFFLANNPRWNLSWIFSCLNLAPPETSPNLRGLVTTLKISRGCHQMWVSRWIMVIIDTYPQRPKTDLEASSGVLGLSAGCRTTARATATLFCRESETSLEWNEMPPTEHFLTSAFNLLFQLKKSCQQTFT